MALAIAQAYRPQSRRRKPPQAAMECAKPQAATELVSQAGKNVSRKTIVSRRSIKLSPCRIISIMDNIRSARQATR